MQVVIDGQRNLLGEDLPQEMKQIKNSIPEIKEINLRLKNGYPELKKKLQSIGTNGKKLNGGKADQFQAQSKKNSSFYSAQNIKANKTVGQALYAERPTENGFILTSFARNPTQQENTLNLLQVNQNDQVNVSYSHLVKLQTDLNNFRYINQQQNNKIQWSNQRIFQLQNMVQNKTARIIQLQSIKNQPLSELLMVNGELKCSNCGTLFKCQSCSHLINKTKLIEYQLKMYQQKMALEIEYLNKIIREQKHTIEQLQWKLTTLGNKKEDYAPMEMQQIQQITNQYNKLAEPVVTGRQIGAARINQISSKVNVNPSIYIQNNQQSSGHNFASQLVYSAEQNKNNGDNMSENNYSRSPRQQVNHMQINGQNGISINRQFNAIQYTETKNQENIHNFNRTSLQQTPNKNNVMYLQQNGNLQQHLQQPVQKIDNILNNQQFINAHSTVFPYYENNHSSNVINSNEISSPVIINKNIQRQNVTQINYPHNIEQNGQPRNKSNQQIVVQNNFQFRQQQQHQQQPTFIQQRGYNVFPTAQPKTLVRQVSVPRLSFNRNSQQNIYFKPQRIQVTAPAAQQFNSNGFNIHQGFATNIGTRIPFISQNSFIRNINSDQRIQSQRKSETNTQKKQQRIIRQNNYQRDEREQIIIAKQTQLHNRQKQCVNCNVLKLQIEDLKRQYKKNASNQAKYSQRLSNVQQEKERQILQLTRKIKDISQSLHSNQKQKIIYEAKIKKISSECLELGEKNYKLTQQISTYKQQIDTYENNTQVLKRQMSLLQRRYNNLSEEYTFDKQKSVKFQKNNIEKNIIIENLKQQKIQLQNNIQGYKQREEKYIYDYNELKNNFEFFKKNARAQRDTTVDLDKKQQIFTKQETEMKKLTQKLKNKTFQYEQSFSIAKEQVLKIKEELQSKDHKIHKQQKYIDQIQEKLNEMSQTISIKNDKANKQEKHIEQIQEQMNKMTEKLFKTQKDYQSFIKKTSINQQQLSKLQKLQKQISQLNLQNHNLKVHNDQYKQQLIKREQNFSKLEMFLQGKKQQILQLQSFINQKETQSILNYKKIQFLQANVFTLQQQKNNSKINQYQIKQQNSQLKYYKQIIEKKNQQCIYSTQQNQTLFKQNNILTTEIQHFKQQIMILLKEKQFLQQQNSSMFIQLQKSKNDINLLSKQINEHKLDQSVAEKQITKNLRLQPAQQTIHKMISQQYENLINDLKQKLQQADYQRNALYQDKNITANNFDTEKNNFFEQITELQRQVQNCYDIIREQKILIEENIHQNKKQTSEQIYFNEQIASTKKQETFNQQKESNQHAEIYQLLERSEQEKLNILVQYEQMQKQYLFQREKNFQLQTELNNVNLYVHSLQQKNNFNQQNIRNQTIQHSVFENKNNQSKQFNQTIEIQKIFGLGEKQIMSILGQHQQMQRQYLSQRERISQLQFELNNKNLETQQLLHQIHFNQQNYISQNTKQSQQNKAIQLSQLKQYDQIFQKFENCKQQNINILVQYQQMQRQYLYQKNKNVYLQLQLNNKKQQKQDLQPQVNSSVSSYIQQNFQITFQQYQILIDERNLFLQNWKAIQNMNQQLIVQINKSQLQKQNLLTQLSRINQQSHEQTSILLNNNIYQLQLRNKQLLEAYNTVSLQNAALTTRTQETYDKQSRLTKISSQQSQQASFNVLSNEHLMQEITKLRNELERVNYNYAWKSKEADEIYAEYQQAVNIFHSDNDNENREKINLYAAILKEKNQYINKIGQLQKNICNIEEREMIQKQQKEQIYKEMNRVVEQKEQALINIKQRYQQVQKIMDEKHQLIQEKKKQISDKDYSLKKKDQIIFELNQLMYEKQQLINEKIPLINKFNELNHEKQQSAKEKEQLFNELNILLYQKQQLINERNQFLFQKQLLFNEINRLTQEKDLLFNERNQLIYQKEQLIHERDQLLHEKNQTNIFSVPQLSNEQKLCCIQKNRQVQKIISQYRKQEQQKKNIVAQYHKIQQQNTKLINKIAQITNKSVHTSAISSSNEVSQYKQKIIFNQQQITFLQKKVEALQNQKIQLISKLDQAQLYISELKIQIDQQLIKQNVLRNATVVNSQLSIKQWQEGIEEPKEMQHWQVSMFQQQNKMLKAKIQQLLALNTLRQTIPQQIFRRQEENDNDAFDGQQMRMTQSQSGTKAGFQNMRQEQSWMGESNVGQKQDMSNLHKSLLIMSKNNKIGHFNVGEQKIPTIAQSSYIMVQNNNNTTQQRVMIEEFVDFFELSASQQTRYLKIIGDKIKYFENELNNKSNVLKTVTNDLAVQEEQIKILRQEIKEKQNLKNELRNSIQKQKKLQKLIASLEEKIQEKQDLVYSGHKNQSAMYQSYSKSLKPSLQISKQFEKEEIVQSLSYVSMEKLLQAQAFNEKLIQQIHFLKNHILNIEQALFQVQNDKQTIFAENIKKNQQISQLLQQYNVNKRIFQQKIKTVQTQLQKVIKQNDKMLEQKSHTILGLQNKTIQHITIIQDLNNNLSVLNNNYNIQCSNLQNIIQQKTFEISILTKTVTSLQAYNNSLNFTLQTLKNQFQQQQNKSLNSNQLARIKQLQALNIQLQNAYQNVNQAELNNNITYENEIARLNQINQQKIIYMQNQNQEKLRNVQKNYLLKINAHQLQLQQLAQKYQKKINMQQKQIQIKLLKDLNSLQKEKIQLIKRYQEDMLKQENHFKLKMLQIQNELNNKTDQFIKEKVKRQQMFNEQINFDKNKFDQTLYQLQQQNILKQKNYNEFLNKIHNEYSQNIIGLKDEIIKLKEIIAENQSRFKQLNQKSQQQVKIQQQLKNESIKNNNILQQKSIQQIKKHDKTITEQQDQHKLQKSLLEHEFNNKTHQLTQEIAVKQRMFNEKAILDKNKFDQTLYELEQQNILKQKHYNEYLSRVHNEYSQTIVGLKDEIIALKKLNSDIQHRFQQQIIQIRKASQQIIQIQKASIKDTADLQSNFAQLIKQKQDQLEQKLLNKQIQFNQHILQLQKTNKIQQQYKSEILHLQNKCNIQIQQKQQLCQLQINQLEQILMQQRQNNKIIQHNYEEQLINKQKLFEEQYNKQSILFQQEINNLHSSYKQQLQYKQKLSQQKIQLIQQNQIQAKICKDDLIKSYEANLQQNNALNSKIIELQMKLKEQQSKLNDANSSLILVEDKFTTQQQYRFNLQAEISIIKDKFVPTQQLLEAHEIINDSEKELQRLKKQLSQISKSQQEELKIIDIKNILQTEQKNKLLLETELQNMKKQYVPVSRLQEAENNVKNQSLLLQTINNSMTKLRNDHREQLNRIYAQTEQNQINIKNFTKQLETKIQELNCQINKIQQQQREHKKNYQQKDNLILALKNNQLQLVKAITQKQQDLNEKNNLITKLNEIIKKLTDQNYVIIELTSQNESLKKKIVDQQKQFIFNLTTLAKQKHNLQLQNLTLQSKIKSLSQDIQKYAQQHFNTQSQLIKQTFVNKEQIASLKDKLNSELNKSVILQQQLQQQNKNNAPLTKLLEAEEYIQYQNSNLKKLQSQNKLLKQKLMQYSPIQGQIFNSNNLQEQQNKGQAQNDAQIKEQNYPYVQPLDFHEPLTQYIPIESYIENASTDNLRNLAIVQAQKIVTLEQALQNSVFQIRQKDEQIKECSRDVKLQTEEIRKYHAELQSQIQIKQKIIQKLSSKLAMGQINNSIEKPNQAVLLSKLMQLQTERVVLRSQLTKSKHQQEESAVNDPACVAQSYVLREQLIDSQSKKEQLLEHINELEKQNYSFHMHVNNLEQQLDSERDQRNNIVTRFNLYADQSELTKKELIQRLKHLEEIIVAANLSDKINYSLAENIEQVQETEENSPQKQKMYLNQNQIIEQMQFTRQNFIILQQQLHEINNKLQQIYGQNERLGNENIRLSQVGHYQQRQLQEAIIKIKKLQSQPKPQNNFVRLQSHSMLAKESIEGDELDNNPFEKSMISAIQKKQIENRKQVQIQDLVLNYKQSIDQISLNDKESTIKKAEEFIQSVLKIFPLEKQIKQLKDSKLLFFGREKNMIEDSKQSIVEDQLQHCLKEDYQKKIKEVNRMKQQIEQQNKRLVQEKNKIQNILQSLSAQNNDLLKEKQIMMRDMEGYKIVQERTVYLQDQIKQLQKQMKQRQYPEDKNHQNLILERQEAENKLKRAESQIARLQIITKGLVINLQKQRDQLQIISGELQAIKQANESSQGGDNCKQLMDIMEDKINQLTKQVKWESNFQTQSNQFMRDSPSKKDTIVQNKQEKERNKRQHQISQIQKYIKQNKEKEEAINSLKFSLKGLTEQMEKQMTQKVQLEKMITMYQEALANKQIIKLKENANQQLQNEQTSLIITNDQKKLIKHQKELTIQNLDIHNLRQKYNLLSQRYEQLLLSSENLTKRNKDYQNILQQISPEITKMNHQQFFKSIFVNSQKYISADKQFSPMKLVESKQINDKQYMEMNIKDSINFQLNQSDSLMISHDFNDRLMPPNIKRFSSITQEQSINMHLKSVLVEILNNVVDKGTADLSELRQIEGLNSDLLSAIRRLILRYESVVATQKSQSLKINILKDEIQNKNQQINQITSRMQQNISKMQIQNQERQNKLQQYKNIIEKISQKDGESGKSIVQLNQKIYSYQSEIKKLISQLTQQKQTNRKQSQAINKHIEQMKLIHQDELQILSQECLNLKQSQQKKQIDQSQQVSALQIALQQTTNQLKQSKVEQKKLAQKVQGLCQQIANYSQLNKILQEQLAKAKKQFSQIYDLQARLNQDVPSLESSVRNQKSQLLFNQHNKRARIQSQSLKPYTSQDDSMKQQPYDSNSHITKIVPIPQLPKQQQVLNQRQQLLNNPNENLQINSNPIIPSQNQHYRTFILHCLNEVQVLTQRVQELENRLICGQVILNEIEEGLQQNTNQLLNQQQCEEYYLISMLREHLAAEDFIDRIKIEEYLEELEKQIYTNNKIQEEQVQRLKQQIKLQEEEIGFLKEQGSYVIEEVKETEELIEERVERNNQQSNNHENNQDQYSDKDNRMKLQQEMIKLKQQIQDYHEDAFKQEMQYLAVIRDLRDKIQQMNNQDIPHVIQQVDDYLARQTEKIKNQFDLQYKVQRKQIQDRPFLRYILSNQKDERQDIIFLKKRIAQIRKKQINQNRHLLQQRSVEINALHSLRNLSQQQVVNTLAQNFTPQQLSSIFSQYQTDDVIIKLNEALFFDADELNNRVDFSDLIECVRTQHYSGETRLSVQISKGLVSFFKARGQEEYREVLDGMFKVMHQVQEEHFDALIQKKQIYQEHKKKMKQIFEKDSSQSNECKEFIEKIEQSSSQKPSSDSSQQQN